MLTSSYRDPRETFSFSPIRKLKIGAASLGRTASVETRAKLSSSRTGSKHPYYGKSLPMHILDTAASLSGTPIYVYDEERFSLVNGVPFRSIRDTAKYLPISPVTLPKKLNTNKPFKGYYYYSLAQPFKPKK